jgi:hypothetical protein
VQTARQQGLCSSVYDDVARRKIQPAYKLDIYCGEAQLSVASDGDIAKSNQWNARLVRGDAGRCHGHLEGGAKGQHPAASHLRSRVTVTMRSTAQHMGQASNSTHMGLGWTSRSVQQWVQKAADRAFTFSSCRQLNAV